MSANQWTFPLVLLVVLIVCLPGHGVAAFGAGNIPSYAYLEGKAFRHGDIEDALAELSKKAGGFALGALIGKGGSKFGGLDIKRVYFGNWLRDYSQAVDIAGLEKLPLQTILNLCMVLGFLAHGYATEEFEVTKDRLGVYLPTEHIDNPKGYGAGKDPRTYDPRLRGPIDPRELEIDMQTGMKNYIANENGHWDTSRALVRRTLEQCIHMGRQFKSTNRKEDQFEAFRLLGQALHTLEDFPAHSNFTELSLVALGHRDVFVHVGDRVRVRAPSGNNVAPLVTGTFGGSDFIHSLLGEAGDHISQASVSDLNKAMAAARSRSVQNGQGPVDTLRDLLFKLPNGSGNDMEREMEDIGRLRDAPMQGGRAPDQMSPQELHAVLWQVLSFRDRVVKTIEQTIEKIPGLGSLIEKLQDSIAVFIYTTLEPYLAPLLKTATSQLMTASTEVINSSDQYEVFNDPSASDPTHSFLSKDHFNLILNEPAGNLAMIIVKYTVNLVVKAWADTSVHPRSVTEDVLQCLFHPEFHDRNSAIQREMMGYMQKWSQSHGNQSNMILGRLTKDAVRNHQNIRLRGEGGQGAAEGSYAANVGHNANTSLNNYITNIPAVQQAQGLYNKVSSFGGPGAGVGREGGFNPGGPAPPMPAIEAETTYRPPPTHSHHPPGAGEADNYYQASSGGPPPMNTSSRPSSNAPSYGGSPSFPGGSSSPYPGQGGPSYPGQGGSSYPSQGGSSYPGQSAPSFPGAATSTYPGQSGGGYGDFSAPGGPPPMPGHHYGASTYPGQTGGAPDFPGAQGGYNPGYMSPPSGPPPPGMPGMPGPGFPGEGGPPPFPGGPRGFPDAQPHHGHHGPHY